MVLGLSGNELSTIKVYFWDYLGNIRDGLRTFLGLSWDYLGTSGTIFPY